MEHWEDPAVLAEEYSPMIYRLAYARTGSQADAEDVVQEVFVRLLKSRPRFRDREHCKSWLLRVAVNCANDLFRLPWRRREEPLTESLPAPQGPEDRGVLEAVLALPEKYRVVVHLYYYEELSTAEIAKIIGRSEGAVKSRLFRARDMLRTALGEEGNHVQG